jgi:hypothetical protein
MAEVISLLPEDEDDVLDLEETVVHNNVPRVLPDGTIFWRNESDIFQCSRIKIAFTIHGAPVALSRPCIRFGYRLFGGRAGFGRPLYNPSQHKLAVFCEVLGSMISSSQSPLFLPLMEPSFPLLATITFRIRRLNSHFVNLRRNRGLRRNAPQTYVIGKLDLDNLVKFTLDAIGSVIYVTGGQMYVTFLAGKFGTRITVRRHVLYQGWRNIHLLFYSIV